MLSDVPSTTVSYTDNSGSPVVTSDGDTLTSAVVWEVSFSGAVRILCDPASYLHLYGAVPLEPDLISAHRDGCSVHYTGHQR